MIETLKQKVLRGEALTDEEAYRLADTADREALYEAAAEITRHYGKPAFNPCSIINARAGQCSENCKWCAQLAHYATHADTHGIVSTPQQTDLFLCGSLGLLDRDALQQLWEAGMRRYHCNLEAAPSYFRQVCTTHTLEEKLQTLRWAREIGFELCSGGIIGMGENRRQRVELALKLREVQLRALHIGINAAVVGDLLTTVGSRIDEDRRLAEEAGYRY